MPSCDQSSVNQWLRRSLSTFWTVPAAPEQWSESAGSQRVCHFLRHRQRSTRCGSRVCGLLGKWQVLWVHVSVKSQPLRLIGISNNDSLFTMAYTEKLTVVGLIRVACTLVWKLLLSTSIDSGSTSRKQRVKSICSPFGAAISSLNNTCFRQSISERKDPIRWSHEVRWGFDWPVFFGVDALIWTCDSNRIFLEIG